MYYSLYDYIVPGLLAPIFVFILLILLCSIISRCITKRLSNPIYATLPFVVSGFITVWCIINFNQGFIYPVLALAESKTPTYVTIGCVDRIVVAPKPPYYYDKNTHRFIPGLLFEIDGEQYYVCNDTIQPGQRLEISWATSGKIVYSFQEATDASKLDGTFLKEEEENISHNNRDRKGEALLGFSAVLFLIMVIAQYPFGRTMANYFRKRDELYFTTVVPNRFGLVYVALLLSPIFGMLLGLYFVGFTGALVIGSVGILIMMFVVIIKQLTNISYQNGYLIIQSIIFRRTIPIRDIVSVAWGNSHIPYNRSLVIELSNHFFVVFEQEHYWGLESMYNTLKSNISRTE